MPTSDELDDTELAQRQERGRLAQRAFRRRQTDTIRELREDNQALRGAIKQILSAAASGPAAQTSGGRASPLTALQNAFRVAGLDPSLANSLADSDPSLTGFSLGAPLFSTPSSQLVIDGQQQSQMSTTSYHQQPATQMQLYSQPPVILVPSYSRMTPAVSDGRMSPRLTYGLWFEPDRAIRIVQPPTDIIPYVGDNMRSLAGAIFWTGMGFSLNCFRIVLNARYRGIIIDPDEPSYSDIDDGDEPHDADNESNGDLSHQPTDAGRIVVGGEDEGEEEEEEAEADRPSSGGSQSQNQTKTRRPNARPGLTRSQKMRLYRHRVRAAQRSITKSFGPTLKLVSDQSVHDVIHARFVWRDKGWIAGDHPGRDPELPMKIFAAIVQDLEHTVSFGEAHLWMTPTEVETYVQQRLYVTPAGWLPWAEALNGRGNKSRIQMIRKLIDLIALRGMCFGDGPRWRVNTIGRLVGKWMTETAAGPQGTGAWT
ncbi:hypothetical protein OQA88_4246 [Cercophora sp. LCS_1]